MIIKINKPTARKLFLAGKNIWLQSSNMHFDNMWQSACKISLFDYWQNIRMITDYREPWEVFKPRFDDLATYTKEEKTRAFDSMCNNYSYYNCDNERGTYIHFYCEEEDLSTIAKGKGRK